MADTNACVFEIVMVNKVVPPALMELSEKLFETVGREGETVSTSAAVQVPAVQDTDEFVLVTLAGGEITAVLVTCVWAWATDTLKNKSHASADMPATRKLWSKNRCKKFDEQKALKKCKERPQNTLKPYVLQQLYKFTGVFGNRNKPFQLKSLKSYFMRRNSHLSNKLSFMHHIFIQIPSANR